MERDLETRFRAAVETAYHWPEGSLAPDVQLRLYAYYKQATQGTPGYRRPHDLDLRNAFKANAWLQIGHMSAKEAMEEYVTMVNAIIKEMES